jgi:peptidoglycan/LPS O-acetylase OafA/YrhL
LAAFIVLYRVYFDEVENVFPNFFGYFPLSGFWKFCFGLVLAQLWTPRTIAFLTGTLLELVAILLLLFMMLYGLPFVALDLSTVAIVLATVFAIAVFSCQSGALSRLLMLPILVLLGDASYALYLWHHMLMMWAGKRLPASFDSGLAQAAAAAAVIGAIILLSVVTYKWFEVPLRGRLAGRIN